MSVEQSHRKSYQEFVTRPACRGFHYFLRRSLWGRLYGRRGAAWVSHTEYPAGSQLSLVYPNTYRHIFVFHHPRECKSRLVCPVIGKEINKKMLYEINCNWKLCTCGTTSKGRLALHTAHPWRWNQSSFEHKRYPCLFPPWPKYTYQLGIAYITFSHHCYVHRQDLHGDDSQDALEGVYTSRNLQCGGGGGELLRLFVTFVTYYNRLALECENMPHLWCWRNKIIYAKENNKNSYIPIPSLPNHHVRDEITSRLEIFLWNGGYKSFQLINPILTF